MNIGNQILNIRKDNQYGFKGKILAEQHLDGDISNAYLAVNLRSIKAAKTAD